MKNIIKKGIATIATVAVVCTCGFAQVGKNVLAYNAGIEAFVNSLYSDCLGRSADPTGFNDWCNKLATGQITGKQAAYGFFFSPEFIAKANAWTDDQLIEAYYRVFLNRGSDPSGLSYWRGKIAGTTNDVSILFTGFADSTEFAGKCASYGITVGSHVDVPTTTRGTSSGGASSGGSATGGSASGLAAQTNGARASSVQELDSYWTSQGFEIFYIDLGNGASQKCYVRWLDMTAHNNQVNSWRNQNGQPSLAILSDPNDVRVQFVRTRAVEVAYCFSHGRPVDQCNGYNPFSTAPAGYPGDVGENITTGAADIAFEAFRNSPLHNAGMLYHGTAMATASCQVAFVQPDGVSTYYDRGRGGFYSPSTGTAEATVQLFFA